LAVTGFQIQIFRYDFDDAHTPAQVSPPHDFHRRRSALCRHGGGWRHYFMATVPENRRTLTNRVAGDYNTATRNMNRPLIFQQDC